jgi:hypothetical protein
VKTLEEKIGRESIRAETFVFFGRFGGLKEFPSR